MSRKAASLPKRRHAYLIPRAGANRYPAWRGAVVIVSTLLLLPIISLAGSFFGGVGEHFSHIRSVLLPRYLLNTLYLTISVASLAGVLGVATAWFVTHYDFPGRKMLQWMLILPLALPAYISAYAYVGIFDYTGVVARVLGGFTIDIAGPVGLTLVMSLALYPYVYVIMRGAFSQQPTAFTEATIAAGSRTLLFRTALSLARPALASGLSLVVMETLNEYGAAFYYGVDTFTTAVFYAWTTLYDLPSAAQLSSLLLLFVLVILTLERAARRDTRFEMKPSERPPRLLSLPRGGTRYWITVACALPIVGGFVAPGAMLVYWTLIRMRGGISGAIVGAAANSVVLALSVALVGVCIAVLLTYGARLAPRGLSRVLAGCTTLGYAVPGAVLGLGALTLLASLRTGAAAPLFDGWLYIGSIAALFYVLLCRYTPVAFQPFRAGFEQIHRSMNETARSLGASPLRSLIHIDLPLLRRVLVGIFVLIFIDVLKDLPLTLILRPFNYETLALRAFRFISDERLTESAPAALLIVIIGALLLLAFYRRFINNR